VPTETKTLAGSTVTSLLAVAALLAGGIAAAASAAEFEASPDRTLADGWIASLEHGPAVERAQRRKARRRARQRREPKVGTPESVGVSSATLEAIAACESGGNPAAVSADGTYRGKYQFSYSTWAAVGGSGDPAAASVAEQDYRAALLYSRSGSGSWPVCG
jgi:soluble lytic murein transglycosylase-like protein